MPRVFSMQSSREIREYRAKNYMRASLKNTFAWIRKDVDNKRLHPVLSLGLQAGRRLQDLY